MRRFLLLLSYTTACVLGFALALFFQWTFSISRTTSRAVYEYRADPIDGQLLRLPTVIEDTSLSILVQPYRPAMTFDLFDPASVKESK